jgi:hypothetical protein
VAKKWKGNFEFVLYVGIIYLNNTPKACRCFRMDRIFRAEGDGVSPVSTRNFEFETAFSQGRDGHL